MAINDIEYASKAALANVSRLHSNANGVAEAFGEIQNAGAIVQDIYLKIPINSSATGGNYALYLVESQDGVEWTDDIDPNSSGDVAAKISDAKLLKSISTIYNASNRAEAIFHIKIQTLAVSEYIGFVLLNNSDQTIPASGADGDSVAYTIASS